LVRCAHMALLLIVMGLLVGPVMAAGRHADPELESILPTTLGGAAHLGRDDLGRLTAGAKADIIVVDLQQVHYGAIYDPIASLIECGSGSDVEMVIVDGEILVEKGKAVRFDESAILREVQAEGERLWSLVPEWHWSGKKIDEIVPMSYPEKV